MSSDGSVMSSVSRIRQFGLYRSIDARTEEFLRASRKRQIRQGCACAAVSTAITVTVVVSVILVYEYSVNGESNSNKKFSFKPNWIGLMNDSTHVSQADTKFTKKINFDKTTIKLLPILIKALNTNRYLEKILEDYSSTSPAYDKKYTTEFAYKKNVFDKKNWIKMPTSRLYTTDYKSSPALLKMPAKNLDFLRTRRKMKDYQRMLNYFDKMVGDKVGSSQQVATNVFESTKGPPTTHTNTPAMKSYNHLTVKQETSTMNVNKIDEKEDLSCKCPKNLGQMLNKLINSLKEMIPNVVVKKFSICENKTSTSTPRVLVNSRQEGYNWRNSLFKTTTESITPKNTQFTTEKSVPEVVQSSTFSSTDSNIIFHKIYFPKDIASPITPNFKGDYNRYYSSHGTKVAGSVDTTVNVKLEKHKALPTTTNHNFHEVILTPISDTSTSKTDTGKGKTKAPAMSHFSKDYEYDDYLFATPSDKKVFHNMAHPKVEIGLTKNQSFTDENESQFDWNSFRKLGSLSKYFDADRSLHKTSEGFINTRKIKDVTHLPPSKDNELVSTKTEADVTESTSSQDTPHPVLVLTKQARVLDSNHEKNIATENEFTKWIEYGTKLHQSDPKPPIDVKVNQEINIDNIMADLDLGKIIPEDEFQEQLSNKHIESVLGVPSEYNNNSKLLDLWDVLNSDNSPTKSMLPPIRPFHLEVLRNSDWRHDDHHDYDSNYNNNAFDTPTI